MNTNRILGFVIFNLMLTFCNAQNIKETKTRDQSSSKIEVLDFHTTHRCVTCNAIEANTKYTLENYFAKELKSGKITFHVVNVDEVENEKLAEKFQASGTSLFLNIIKDGKEKQVDLTDFAFMYGKNKEKFSSKLKSKIDKEISNL
ncbi:MAG: hypothetical protein H6567_10320 [Lewinellaceae bacterium]|nr:hypothetical protein [Lewinellaceae bacterium]